MSEMPTSAGQSSAAAAGLTGIRFLSGEPYGRVLGYRGQRA